MVSESYLKPTYSTLYSSFFWMKNTSAYPISYLEKLSSLLFDQMKLLEFMFGDVGSVS